MEGLECFVIFAYGITNVFLEHLSAWGEGWVAQDFEHVAISLLFIGGGLVNFNIHRWPCDDTDCDIVRHDGGIQGLSGILEETNARRFADLDAWVLHQSRADHDYLSTRHNHRWPPAKDRGVDHDAQMGNLS